MWYVLLKEGAWYEKHNLKAAILNGVVFLVGMIVFGCGTYASIAELVSLFPFHHPSAGTDYVSQVDKFQSGSVSKPFTCA